MVAKITPPEDESTWKAEVRDYFAMQKVGKHQTASLEALLLSSASPQSARKGAVAGTNATLAHSVPAAVNSPQNQSSLATPSVFVRAARQMHSSRVGYVASALIASFVTFVAAQTWGPGGLGDDPFDPIADLANQPGPKAYPADFDLEGDASGFREVVEEVFPQQDIFSADLGKQLADEGYSPREGRFFTWSGEPGVSILLKGKEGEEDKPATLYIVRLTEKNEQKFPRERTLKRVGERAGKLRKVNVWRDGRYGYAMVQSAHVPE